MVMKIGNGGHRPYMRPKTYDIQHRITQRVESLVSAHNKSRDTALGIMGVPVLVWQKASRGRGSVPCSCSYHVADTLHTLKDQVAGGEIQQVVANRLDTRLDGNSSNYTIEGFDIPKAPISVLEDPSYDPDIDEQDDFPDVTVEEPDDIRDSGYLAKVIDQGPFGGAALIQCPVCYGTGYVDAWKPFKCERIVLDFGPNTVYTLDNAHLLEDSKPARLRIELGGSVTWSSFLPRAWESILRVQVWDQDQYTSIPLELDTGSLAGGAPAWQPVTVTLLKSLNGSGGPCSFRIRATDRSLKLTHVELILGMAGLPMADIPPIDIPYDGEFVDYTTTTQIELAGEVEVDPGDVICESRYNRPWRITSLDQKETGLSSSLGSQATVRAVGSKEVFWTMNIFTPKDEALHQYRGRLEIKQGRR